MPPRVYVDLPLQQLSVFELPADAVRHIQVLRLQPGSELTLFNGRGGEWPAEVIRMGRSECEVKVASQIVVDRELPAAVSLAIGMPTNERMDGVIEKATELGAAAIEPLICERSVLRLSGERAERRCSHWQAIAVAAAEQCGRTRVPSVSPISTFAAALSTPRAGDDAQWLVLSLGAAARPAAEVLAPLLAERRPLRIFSGPEGGLSPAEERAVAQAGALPLGLGPRVLRADTAPLAVLALIGALGAAA